MNIVAWQMRIAEADGWRGCKRGPAEARPYGEKNRERVIPKSPPRRVRNDAASEQRGDGELNLCGCEGSLILMKI